jgi:hypothetical protein
MSLCDLACGRVTDELERERALEHTASCHKCAGRLADEQRLSAGLKALAEFGESRNAPQSVELALSAYFRNKALNEAREPRAAIRWSRMPGWAWAAAAVVLVVMGLIAAVTIRQQPDNRPAVVEVPTPSPAQSIVPRPVKQTVAETNHPVQQIRKPKRAGQAVAKKRPADPISDRIVIREEMTLYISEQEVATDFIPFYYSADAQPMEQGRLIRVQMPRSALLKFGLPMNFERANVPVKADLLIGEDGLAQAIRFIR